MPIIAAMPTAFRALTSLIVRARYLLPAFAMALLAAPVAHPATLLPLMLAIPLYFAGAAAALGYHLEQSFARFALRRGSVAMVLFTFYAGAVAVGVGWPLVLLVGTGKAAGALVLALGFLVVVSALWRSWPIFALVYLWDDAYPEQEPGSWMRTAISRCNEFARHLTGERDTYFGRGLPLALLLVATLGMAMSIAGLGGLLPTELRLGALWIYAFALAPVTAFAFVWRSERLLLADAAEHDDEAQAVHPERVPTAHAPVSRDPARLRIELLEAAAAGQVDRALQLIESGVHANAMPEPHERDQRSLAIIAATCPDLRLLRAAIARGADVNQAVADLTPLLAATRDSYQGRPDSVMTLLANGADPRATDAQGNTPLHHAALACEAAVTAILLDADAPHGLVNRDGLTPLAVAAAAGNVQVVKLLLERGAAPNPEQGVAALQSAAQGADDRPDLVKLLVKHRAQVHARDRLGRTALHAAALHGHPEMVDALIAAGADLNARDQLGVTPLMEAARGGHNRVLQRLVFRKPATEHADHGGRTALLIACQSARANEDTARLLLAMGADPRHATNDGRRALDVAVAAGRWLVVALLDPHYPLPASLTRDDIEPDAGGHAPDRAQLLARALRHGRCELAQELCALEPRLAAEELATAFLQAADGATPEALELALRAGLDPHHLDAQGRGLVERVLAREALPRSALSVLIPAGASVAGQVGHTLVERLLEAGDALDEDEDLALAILAAGGDPFRRDAKGRTLLHVACTRARTRVVRALIERGVDPNAVDARGRTPLHELAHLPESVSLAMARLLLAAGADPERRAADGQTALGAALAAGRGRLARLWTSELWRYPGRALLPSDLPAAAALGDRAALERLLDMGLPMEGRDAQGCTALVRAAGAGHTALVDWLLARGADPTAAASTGATALTAAISAGRGATVECLLARGVPVNAALPGGVTPLMIAAALGAQADLERLLAHGANLNQRDEQGQAALHAACQFAFSSPEPDPCRRLLEALLSAGAEIEAQSRAGQTPLLILLGARAAAGHPSPQRGLTELVELLLARGADPDAQDQRGVGVLHAAAMHGLAEPCRSLLRAGADPSLRDTLGRTAAEVALMLGYADLAAEIKRAAGARVRAVQSGN